MTCGPNRIPFKWNTRTDTAASLWPVTVGRPSVCYSWCPVITSHLITFTDYEVTQTQRESLVCRCTSSCMLSWSRPSCPAWRVIGLRVQAREGPLRRVVADSWQGVGYQFGGRAGSWQLYAVRHQRDTQGLCRERILCNKISVLSYCCVALSAEEIIGLSVRPFETLNAELCESGRERRKGGTKTDRGTKWKGRGMKKDFVYFIYLWFI